MRDGVGLGLLLHISPYTYIVTSWILWTHGRLTFSTGHCTEVMAEASAAREAESVKHRLRRACPPVESGGDIGRWWHGGGLDNKTQGAEGPMFHGFILIN